MGVAAAKTGLIFVKQSYKYYPGRFLNQRKLMSNVFLPPFRHELRKERPDSQKLEFGLRLINRELGSAEPTTRRWKELHSVRTAILVAKVRTNPK